MGDIYVIDANTGQPVKSDSGQSYTTILNQTATVSGSGNNTLVAAPAAGNYLAIHGFVIQNESATATTMILGGCWRNLAQNQGDGLAMVFDENLPWKLAESTALVLNLSGANVCGYSIQYSIEPV